MPHEWTFNNHDVTNTMTVKPATKKLKFGLRVDVSVSLSRGERNTKTLNKKNKGLYVAVEILMLQRISQYAMHLNFAEI